VEGHGVSTENRLLFWTRPDRPPGTERGPVDPVALAHDVVSMTDKGHPRVARSLLLQLPGAVAHAVDLAEKKGYAAGLAAAEKTNERMPIVPPDLARELIRHPDSRYWVQNVLDLDDRDLKIYGNGVRFLSTYQRKKLAKALDTVERVEKIRAKIPKAKGQPPKRKGPYKWKPSR
jgi:hypothetical protein